MHITVVVPVGLQSAVKQNKWQECMIIAPSMSLCSLESIYLNSKSTQFAFKLLSKPESGTRRGELLRACLACKHSTHARNVRKNPKIVVASGGDGRAACRPLCDRHGTERGGPTKCARSAPERELHHSATSIPPLSTPGREFDRSVLLGRQCSVCIHGVMIERTIVRRQCSVPCGGVAHVLNRRRVVKLLF